MEQWNLTSRSLPDPTLSQLVILWYELSYGSYYNLGWYGQKEDDEEPYWYDDDGHWIEEPIHWMHLPEPPSTT